MHCLKRHFTSKMAIGVSSRHRHTHVLGVVLIPYFGWMRIQLYPLFWREQKGTYFFKNGTRHTLWWAFFHLLGMWYRIIPYCMKLHEMKWVWMKTDWILTMKPSRYMNPEKLECTKTKLPCFDPVSSGSREEDNQMLFQAQTSKIRCNMDSDGSPIMMDGKWLSDW